MTAELTGLEAAVSTSLADAHLELVDVEFHHHSLVVTVTRAGGLDLDALAEAARTVSAALDANEHLTPDGPFELEVTSPGLERRLRRPEHFIQALGATVAVRTVAGTEGARRVEGVLAQADEHGIAVATSSEGVRELGYDAIDRAHTVFDWKAALAADKLTRGAAHEGRRGHGHGQRGRDERVVGPSTGTRER